MNKTDIIAEIIGYESPKNVIVGFIGNTKKIHDSRSTTLPKRPNKTGTKDFPIPRSACDKTYCGIVSMYIGIIANIMLPPRAMTWVSVVNKPKKKFRFKVKIPMIIGIIIQASIIVWVTA